jgi:hypothetical protein
MQQIDFKKLLSGVTSDVSIVDLYSKYRPVLCQEIKPKKCSLKLLIWKDQTGDHSIDFTKDESFYLTGLGFILSILQRSLQKITDHTDEQVLVFKVIMTIDAIDYSIEKREQRIKFIKEADPKQPTATTYKVKTQMCLSQFSSSLNINTGVTTTSWKTISSSPATIYSFVRTNIGKSSNMIVGADTSFMAASPKQRLDKIFEWLAVDSTNVINDIYDKKIISSIKADISKLKIQLYKLPVPTIELINIQAVIESQRVINENLSTLQARQQNIEKHITDIRQLQVTMFTFGNLQEKVNLLSDILKKQNEFVYKQSMKDYNHVFSASQVEITPDDDQFFTTWENKSVSPEIITQATVTVELLSAELKNNPVVPDLPSKLKAAKQELDLLNDIQANRAKLKQRQKYLDYLETVKEERLKGEVIRLKSQIDTITLIQKELNLAIDFKSSDAQDNKIMQSVTNIQSLLLSVINNANIISKVSSSLDAHLKLCVTHESDIKQDIEDNYGKLGKLSHLIIKHKKYLTDKQEYDKQADAKKAEISNLELLLSCIKKRRLAIEFIKEHIKNINSGLADLINKYNTSHETKLPNVSYVFVGEGIKAISEKGQAASQEMTESQQITIILMTRNLINQMGFFQFKLMFLIGDHPITNLGSTTKYCISYAKLNKHLNAFPTVDCKGPPTAYCVENPAEQLLNRHIEERKQAKLIVLEQKRIKTQEEKKLLSEIKDTENTNKLVEQENKNTLLADDKEKTLKEREKIRLAMEAEQKENPVLFVKKPKPKPVKK